MSNTQDNLLYTQEHEWVLIENDHATIGITDFAQNSLGDIVFVELPEQDTEVQEGESFGVVESIKSVSDLYSPLDGIVLEKNDEVEESPENINKNAFGAWLIKIKITDMQKVEGLMSAEQYKSFCSEQS